MTLPSYEEFMLPLLNILSDGKPHSISDLQTRLPIIMKLDEEDKKRLLPSGRHLVYISRIGWARTYLHKAKLLEITARGIYKITERGQNFLKQNPVKIDYKSLLQFEEFKTFLRPSGNNTQIDNKTEITLSTEDPEDLMEKSYQTIKQALSEELLEIIKSNSSDFFEHLVVDLLLEMGYGGSRQEAIASVTQKSRDGGIDGTIQQDKLGFDTIYIQAKKWDDETASVGRKEIQAFVGSLEMHHAQRGVFITTSKFTNDAKEYITKISKKIVLIDGKKLMDLLIDHNIGVSEKMTYSIKKIDSDYFEQ